MKKIKIRTLDEFYATMEALRELKKVIVEQYFDDQKLISQQEIDHLKAFEKQLADIEKENDQYKLKIDEQKAITVDLTYEIEELRKDIIFLEQGEEAFTRHLCAIHNHYESQVSKGVEFLHNRQVTNFITDRDGTVNNYCGRYRSSVQSIYNAIYLTRYARNCAGNSIILTSAPLKDPGLVDVSVTPDKDFIYAASKGREYVVNGQRDQLAIDANQQARLDELNQKLSALLQKPEYHKFSVIGSGIQFKFGQTTVARQDVSKAVPEKESMQFLTKIRELVKAVDPDAQYFRIEDTGMDIEIILTISGTDGAAKDFDKGDGVLFLNNSLNLGVENGVNLVCGDTNSDVPMVSKVMEQSKETYVIFVTEKADLRQKVSSMLPPEKYLFVSTPDVLVGILNEVSKEKTQ